MHWTTLYEQKKCTAAQAVKKIRSGDRVVIGHAVSEPTRLVEAMVDGRAAPAGRGGRAHDRHGGLALLQTGDGGPFSPQRPLCGGQHPQGGGGGARRRDAGVLLRDTALLRGGLPPDVALVQLSPPDEHGYCSFGVAVDYTKPAAEAAKVVLAQINPRMPRTLGDSFIHVSRLDAVVEADDPILELQPPAIGEVERSIGKHCAYLIRDGDTLQLGIGAIPDAVLLFLKGKKDLGIHSEMFSDGVVELVEAGVVTNARKNLHPGKSVVTFLMGTRRLYDYVNDNPEVEMYPVDYVNDPRVIAQNDNLVSINSCVQVDLMGQVVSTSVGLRQISGVGGQVDFVRGAKIEPRRQVDHGDALHRRPRRHQQDRAPDRRGRGGDDQPLRCGLCGHRVRHRRAAGQNAAAAGPGADRHRAPGLSRRPVRRVRKALSRGVLKRCRQQRKREWARRPETDGGPVSSAAVFMAVTQGWTTAIKTGLDFVYK